MDKKFITEIQDFPIEGVSFKDISPLLANEEMFCEVIVEMSNLLYNKKIPDYWIGIDARGFIFASALSVWFGGGVVMCRKAGKLPPPIASHKYKTEYSEDELEMRSGSGTVVIVDDVLATGGTLRAVNELCQIAGNTVIHNIVLIDLQYIPRVDNFDLEVKSLIQYE